MRSLTGTQAAHLAGAVVFVMLSGCAIERAAEQHTAARVDEAIAQYRAAAAQVTIGDPKEKVLGVLEPSQVGLLYNQVKPPEAFHAETETGGTHLIEIYFYRSGRYTDELPDRQGFPPDDDFTPYIFTDGVLTATGWPSLSALHAQRRKPLPARDQGCNRFGPVMGCF